MYPRTIHPIVYRLLLPILPICWMTCETLIAQQAASSDSFSEQLDEFANNLMSCEMAPGVAIVVVRGDETLFNRGYGMADAEISRKVTPDTVFYIASSTKSFTGLAAAICDERGELDLDETLDRSLADANFHKDIDPKSISADLRRPRGAPAAPRERGPALVREGVELTINSSSFCWRRNRCGAHENVPLPA